MPLRDATKLGRLGPVGCSRRISAGLGGDLKGFAEARGLDLGELARSAGLLPEDFESPERRIAIGAFACLLNSIRDRSDDDTIGLLYGREYQIGNTGPLGFALLNAPNLGEALHIYSRYQRLAGDDPCLSICTGPQGIGIAWETANFPDDPTHFNDFWAVLILRVVQHFAGPSACPASIELARPPPRTDKLHRQIFGYGLTFSAPLNQLRFDGAGILDDSPPSSDPRLLKLLLANCEAQMALLPPPVDLRKRVQDLILGELPQRTATLPFIARELAMSERSLQRRLEQLGTSFGRLLDETRRELSDRLLQTGKLSLCEISDRCGYSNASSYSRAARSWYGTPPAKLRQRGTRAGI